MRDLRGDVDRARPPLELVHVFGEALPLPVQAGGQHRIGNFLDALHQVHQRLAMVLLHRRKADAAVAEHHRSDAMPARRREQRVPHRLAVIVRVDVDPAGRDQETVGVDFALGRALLAAHRGDAVAGDRHVTRERRLAGAIDDGAAANDDVVHGSRSGCDPAMMLPAEKARNARVDGLCPAPDPRQPAPARRPAPAGRRCRCRYAARSPPRCRAGRAADFARSRHCRDSGSYRSPATAHPCRRRARDPRRADRPARTVPRSGSRWRRRDA